MGRENSGVETALTILFFLLSPSILSAGQLTAKTGGAFYLFHFNEGSGTPLYDSALTTSAQLFSGTWVSGKYSNAISFDGLATKVDLGSCTVCSPVNGPGTYIFGIKSTADGGIITKGAGIDPSEFRFEVTGNNLRLQFVNQTAAASIILIASAGTNFNDNKWHRVGFSYAVVVNGSPVEMYADGTRVNFAAADESVNTMTANGSLLTIGKAFGGFFNGVIDECVFYARRFGDSEWKADYNNWLGKSHGNEVQ